MDDLTGRVALVTGGSRGIGRSTAQALARAGAKVGVIARTASTEIVPGPSGADGSGITMQVAADVGDAECLVAAISDVVANLGPVAILINNAATLGPMGPIHGLEPEAWTQSLSVNVGAAFQCAKMVLPGMLDRGWGRIINVTSIAGSPPGIHGLAAYSVGKAALNQLTLVMALECDETGVAVSAFDPGPVDTSMQKTLRTSQQRLGTAITARYRDMEEKDMLRPPAECGVALAVLAASGVNGEIVRMGSPRIQEIMDDFHRKDSKRDALS